MFIETKTFTVKAGYSDKILSKFTSVTKIKEAEGFLELCVSTKLRKGETEDILVMTRWADQKAYTNWKNSASHKAGHSQKQEKPEFIVNVSMETYAVQVLETK